MKWYWYQNDKIREAQFNKQDPNTSRKCVCGHHENEHYGSGNGHVCSISECKCINSIYND